MAHAVHYLFEWAALATGLLVYRLLRAKRGEPGVMTPGPFAVMVGGLLGAAVGSKAAFWVNNPQLWESHATALSVWLRGQSLVGGLLGGWFGVEIGKRVSGLSRRTGDDYVLPVLSGLVVGRIGCFLAGLHDGTCGVPTQRPWGVDFGDGIPRHPAQLYECLLALLALIAWPLWRRPFAAVPGLAFRAWMLAYLLWRVGVDTLKPVPYAYALGLSGLQWICIQASVFIAIGLVHDAWRAHDESET